MLFVIDFDIFQMFKYFIIFLNKAKSYLQLLQIHQFYKSALSFSYICSIVSYLVSTIATLFLDLLPLSK